MGAYLPPRSAARAPAAIVEDAIGNLWIRPPRGGGLNLLDRRTGRFYTYRRDDRDPASPQRQFGGTHCISIIMANCGSVPAGGGLDRVIGSSVQPSAVRFENQSGLGGISAQVVYGIESDREDRLWLSTNNGLARFDPRAHSTKWFHQVHGLQDEEFNFNAPTRAPTALSTSAATMASTRFHRI